MFEMLSIYDSIGNKSQIRYLSIKIDIDDGKYCLANQRCDSKLK